MSFTYKNSPDSAMIFHNSLESFAHFLHIFEVNNKKILKHIYEEENCIALCVSASSTPFAFAWFCQAIWISLWFCQYGWLS